MFIVFKAESEPKHEEKNLFGVFLQKPKTHFLGGENKIVLKLNFKICISAFLLYCKRKLSTNFQKKILEFFENENFDVCAPARDARSRRNFGFGQDWALRSFPFGMLHSFLF